MRASFRLGNVDMEAAWILHLLVKGIEWSRSVSYAFAEIKIGIRKQAVSSNLLATCQMKPRIVGRMDLPAYRCRTNSESNGADLKKNVGP
jgi:hypothetical protein